MSMVLWANYLVDGKVTSDESDKYALYQHAETLDRISREHSVTPFFDTHDSTDMEFNVGDGELPEGMESTDELMAVNGRWIEASAAIEMLQTLLRVLKDGDAAIDADDREDLVEELEESIGFARRAKELSAQFNFSVVM